MALDGPRIKLRQRTKTSSGDMSQSCPYYPGQVLCRPTSTQVIQGSNCLSIGPKDNNKRMTIEHAECSIQSTLRALAIICQSNSAEPYLTQGVHHVGLTGCLKCQREAHGQRSLALVLSRERVTSCHLLKDMVRARSVLWIEHSNRARCSSYCHQGHPSCLSEPGQIHLSLPGRECGPTRCLP